MGIETNGLTSARKFAKELVFCPVRGISTCKYFTINASMNVYAIVINTWLDKTTKRLGSYLGFLEFFWGPFQVVRATGIRGDLIQYVTFLPVWTIRGHTALLALRFWNTEVNRRCLDMSARRATFQC